MRIHSYRTIFCSVDCIIKMWKWRLCQMNIFFDLLKTVCNPETIYNMYSIIETNYVSSGLLFIYFYYIKAISIAFCITVVISRASQCIYSCYRYLAQEHQGIDKNTFSRSRKSVYFALGSIVVIGWLRCALQSKTYREWIWAY